MTQAGLVSAVTAIALECHGFDDLRTIVGRGW